MTTAPRVTLSDGVRSFDVHGTAAELLLEVAVYAEQINAAPAGTFVCDFGAEAVHPSLRITYPRRRRDAAA
jgi:hypothetical protein